jgi:hypothetical protein
MILASGRWDSSGLFSVRRGSFREGERFWCWSVQALSAFGIFDPCGLRSAFLGVNECNRLIATAVRFASYGDCLRPLK